jgi:arylsulfatase A-like enzyme
MGSGERQGADTRRALTVRAYVAALDWVETVTDAAGSPALIDRLAEESSRLESDGRDPVEVLISIAAAAVAQSRTATSDGGPADVQ